jgi:hypothetical protein
VRGTGKAVGVGGAVESEKKGANRGCVGEGAEGMEKVWGQWGRCGHFVV